MPECMIGGIPVNFPFEPYSVQKAYMEKVIECLQNGHNGVLESPTGTGKTLSLLCSSLAWLMVKKAQLQAHLQGGLYELEGGDFVTGLKNDLNSAAGVISKGESSMWGMPKIIYASRTHSQLSQAMQELKKTAYNHIRAAVIGSRDQMCLDKEIIKEQNNNVKIHMCRSKISSRSCFYYNNVDSKKEDPQFTAGGILDIEDLVKVGQQLRCCPYFVSRELKQNADIIFMPYNYVLDASTRKAHGIELANNIILLDEGHNIEKMCEESASFQIRSTDIALCIDEVTQVMRKIVDESNEDYGFIGETVIVPKDFTPDDLCILKTIFLELEKAVDDIPVSGEGSTYPGSFMFELLAKAELTFRKKTVVLELLDKLIQYLSTTSTSPHQRKGAGLQKFADLMKTVFSSEGNLRYEDKIKRCYKVYVTIEEPKTKKQKDSWNAPNPIGHIGKAQGRIINYWCFSPGFGMQMLMEQGARCVVLTSGTLAPLKPLVSEMGIPIQVQLENPHVATAKQVFVGIISKGPDGVQLSSSYNTRNDPKYISSLGRTILNFARLIPDGLLVFFPSYPVLKKCQSDWQETGIWSQICELKPIYVEPQSKDGFLTTMTEYYSKIHDPNTRGACFMAVTRGKVSEGLDFADHNGRAVIITGLPYPPFKDPRVVLKQQYLEELRKQDKEGLSGNDWYQLEASRAVNQAMGRVLRHAKDYGAILLCDYRFNNQNFKRQLSSWLQPHIKCYETFGPLAKNIREFYSAAEILYPCKKLLKVCDTSTSLYLPPVAASFDSVTARSTPASAKAKSVNTESEWSVEEYKTAQLDDEVKPKVLKDSPHLFQALDKPTLAINFNDTFPENSPSCSSRNESRNLVNINPTKKRKLKVAPIDFRISSNQCLDLNNLDSCNEKRSKAYLSNNRGVVGSQKICVSDLPDSRKLVPTSSKENDGPKKLDKKQEIAVYVQQVKNALTPENYKVFSSTIQAYTKEKNYEKLVDTLKILFLHSRNLHPLFKGFYRFIKSEHSESFKSLCQNLSS